MTTNMKSKQLKVLLNDFELLSQTVLLQLQLSAKLMLDRGIESLEEEAESNELIIDRVEIKIREEVVYSIFQFTPKAADLRRIVTYQDITTNLERVGDMLLNIIHYSRETNLNLAEFTEERKQLSKMFQYVDEMLRNAIISFTNEDTALAYVVIKEDDKVDKLFHDVSRSTQTSFSGRSLTEDEVRNIININSIAHNLERIGDSATNICESTIYLTEGRDIRHGNKD